MNNLEIADLLRAASTAYELKGGGSARFKSIAYDRAADAVEHLSSEAKDLWDEGKLEDVSGIGKSIATHLDEIFRSGKSTHFKKVFSDIAPAVFELIKVPGIGPKNAIKFSSTFGISSANGAIEKLEKKAKQGKIAELEGFGKDSEQAVIDSIAEYKNKDDARMLISKAEEISSQLIDWMSELKSVKDINTLGSSRRKASTVGDIDIAVSTSDPDAALEHFTKYPHASRVLEKGTRTSSIILPGNIQADLMVETPDAYGALLQHFTGSKHHNIAIREYAQKKGWKVSDYGITIKGKLHKIKTEQDFYNKLGMEWVPPELREDRGEIELALKNKIPKLVELKDMRGDLHIHSDFDIETSHDIGVSSMKVIVENAKSLGYEYIAFTEHNPSQLKHNQKQIIKLLTAKQSKINTLSKAMKHSVKIFNSLEIDILPNGDLPVSEEALDVLDFGIVSIHSSFKQSRDKQTERVLKALDHPKVKIFAHPTARKINAREGVELNWEKIFDFCLKNKKFIEINSSPERLDLPDFMVHEAVKKGIKLVISTDSHDVNHMQNMKYGVYVARRGWCTKKDILNTYNLSSFEKALGI